MEFFVHTIFYVSSICSNKLGRDHISPKNVSDAQSVWKCNIRSISAPRSWMKFTPSPLSIYCKQKQFFKYNLGKFLKYIAFLSCSLIIFESLPKLYLKICFFSIKC